MIMSDLWDMIADVADLNKDGAVTVEEFQISLKSVCQGKEYDDLPSAFKQWIVAIFNTIDTDGEKMVPAICQHCSDCPTLGGPGCSYVLSDCGDIAQIIITSYYPSISFIYSMRALQHPLTCQYGLCVTPSVPLFASYRCDAGCRDCRAQLSSGQEAHALCNTVQ